MSLLAAYEVCNDPAFFECGAVELAEKLLKRYLYCYESKILVRIVETEAYPYGDEVYRKLFDAVTPSFPKKAGVVVQLSKALHNKRPRLQGDIHQHLYISAGGTDDARDLVRLRSCEPHVLKVNKYEGDTAYIGTIIQRLGWVKTPHARKNILIDPYVVAKALASDWVSNPFLYQEGGVQLLLHKKVVAEPGSGSDSKSKATEPDPERTLHGRRILSKAKFSEEFAKDPPSGGVEDKYRFALDTEMKYNYELRTLLE